MTESSIDHRADAPTHRADGPWLPVAVGLCLPIFFVMAFSVTYVTAFHKPAPHNAPVVLVGNPTATANVEAALETAQPNAFDITTTTSATVARNAITSEKAIGAIAIGPSVTAYVAPAAGGSTPAVIEAMARGIAAGQHVDAKVVIVSPTTNQDALGSVLFYFFIAITIGSYLSVMVTSQVAPGLKVLHRQAIAAGMAVLLPVIALAMTSITVGKLGASTGAVFAWLAVAMLYALTVGTISILSIQLAGKAAAPVVLSLVVFLNLPSSGGAIPASFLPHFWQGIHSFWFGAGAGALEATRSIVYFGGTNAWPWIVHLSLWLIVAACMSTAVARGRRPQSDPAEAEHPDGDAGLDPYPGAPRILGAAIRSDADLLP